MCNCLTCSGYLEYSEVLGSGRGLCNSRKYLLHPQKGWEFPGGGGGGVLKGLQNIILIKCMKFDWNLQRGGGGGV